MTDAVYFLLFFGSLVGTVLLWEIMQTKIFSLVRVELKAETMGGLVAYIMLRLLEGGVIMAILIFFGRRI